MNQIPRIRSRAAATLLALTCAAVLLTGCEKELPEPTGTITATFDKQPAATTEVLLETPYAATVIETGDSGVQMCVGAVSASYPPQCGGPSLLDWDWSEWTGSYEQFGEVHWGAFALTGRYDADAFTFQPTVIEPWRDDMVVDSDRSSLSLVSPCAAPDGGWRVLDPARTTDETMQRATERARQLDGFAEVWVDRSRVPTAGADATPEQQLAETAPSPAPTILNVRVVGDVEVATAQLREVWGGMLCVSEGTRTADELQAIMDDILAATPRDILSAAPDGLTGVVRIDVIYDDGTLQEQMDALYGSAVLVESILKPAVSE